MKSFIAGIENEGTTVSATETNLWLDRSASGADLLEQAAELFDQAAIESDPNEADSIRHRATQMVIAANVILEALKGFFEDRLELMRTSAEMRR